MSGVTPDPLPAPVRGAWSLRCLQGERTLDVFIAAVPASERDDEPTQFSSMATRALDGLAAQGLVPGDIACGWIHMARTPSWEWRSALAQIFRSTGPLPITALVQSPAEPHRFCTMQLHAIRSTRQSGVWHGNVAEPAAATVLRSGARHLRLMGVTPRPELVECASVADLAYDMLAQAGHALRARGLCFADVVRAWIYVQGIERHIGTLTQVRNRYFAEQRLLRPPASSCIEASLLGSAVPIAMDLYAIGPSDGVEIIAVSAGVTGETRVDGPAIAQGTQILEAKRNTVYLAGVGSTDAAGAVVAVGDIDGQLARTFANLQALLAAAGLAPSDALNATVYLKQPGFRQAYARAVAAAGLPPEVPVAVVVADLGRPDSLCEIELCAARVSPR